MVFRTDVFVTCYLYRSIKPPLFQHCIYRKLCAQLWHKRKDAVLTQDLPCRRQDKGKKFFGISLMQTAHINLDNNSAHFYSGLQCANDKKARMGVLSTSAKFPCTYIEVIMYVEC